MAPAIQAVDRAPFDLEVAVVPLRAVVRLAPLLGPEARSKRPIALGGPPRVKTARLSIAATARTPAMARAPIKVPRQRMARRALTVAPKKGTKRPP